MEHIWQWGINVIIVVQKIRSPFFDSFFSFVSFFGELIFYMALLPFLYWCFDKKSAARIFVLFLISSWVNTVLKDLINHPRPYNLNESVKIGKTPGPGIPSGHAQLSLVVWGSMSLWLKKRFFTYASIFIILIIAFSRIYLGVHFPTDVLGGWFLGALALIMLWPFFDKIEKFLLQFSPVILAAVAIIIPGLLSQIIASKGSVMSMGALSGFCVGIIIENRYIKFSPAANFKTGFLRVLIGLTVLMLVYFAEKILFSKSSQYYLIFIFVHSWILCLWVCAGAPWLFKKFKV